MPSDPVLHRPADEVGYADMPDPLAAVGPTPTNGVFGHANHEEIECSSE
jgi:hypothetical protein